MALNQLVDNGHLAECARKAGLDGDVLRLVGDAMCFSAVQREALDAETRSKVELMRRGEQFGPYRACLISEVPIIATRVTMLQKQEDREAEKKSAAPAKQKKAVAPGKKAVPGGFLNNNAKSSKPARAPVPKKAAPPAAAAAADVDNAKSKPTRAPPAADVALAATADVAAAAPADVASAAAALGVDEDMLRAVAQAMVMPEIAIASIADPEALEKIKGVREGDAFAEVRNACERLGLVSEARKIADVALESDGAGGNMDESQIAAAARALALTDAQVEQLDGKAKLAVTALREDPVFAGVRAVVKERRTRNKPGKEAGQAAPVVKKPTPWRKKPEKQEEEVPSMSKLNVADDDSDEEDDDEGGWSEVVEATTLDEGGEAEATTREVSEVSEAQPAAQTLDDDKATLLPEEDDLDDDEAVAAELLKATMLPALPHEMGRTTDGSRRLVISLEPGVRCDSLDVDADRIRVTAPGAALLDLRLESPNVDPRGVTAKYSKKASTLTILLPPAPPPTEHETFMEDLGREAKKRGYMPNMSSIDDYKDAS